MKVLEFEKPIAEIQKKIAELRALSDKHVDFKPEIKKLEELKSS
jgi:acetyl-CoA carboxylase alpha subunit